MKPQLGDKVLVVHTAQDMMFGLRVSIAWRVIGGEIEIGRFNKQGRLEFTPVPKHARIDDPTMVLDPETANQLVKALLEAGAKNPDESKTQGLYEAQSEHLKDMRRLVFEEDDPIVQL